MSTIIPISSTRVSDYFVRQRLIEQIQSDQLDLFRLQYQVSTGQRIQLPSEDTAAALRVIDLQRLIDRKEQIQTNVASSDDKLTAAESYLSSVSTLLSGLRADALTAVSTTATDADRQAVIQQLDEVIQSLVDTANSEWEGEYLFAGSTTQSAPYLFDETYVQYVGNETTLNSYIDLERLFSTNMLGTEAFGGISTAVEGSADLNPRLTSNTRLSSLNGGDGISSNAAVSISIETGGVTTSSVVDLSRAATLRDVARMIEANAPDVANVTVEVSGTGLVLETDTGNIRVNEAGSGRTARELGIYTGSSGAASSTIEGSDLDPVVTKSTRLDDLLGTKAQGRLVSSGANNDILLTAAQNGDSLNGITVEFVSDAVAGSETASYSAGTLTVHMQDGFSTADQIAAAITAEGTFVAEADYRDALTTAQAGSGSVDAGSFSNATSGGSGEVFDSASGLIVGNGGDPLVLDTSDAVTVEDLLNVLNGAELGLQAEINDDRDGINIRSRLSGADLTIGENGGTTATQLGVRTYTEDTKLAEFNRGVGVPTSDIGDDLSIVASDGTGLSIDLSGATDVEDVIEAINAAGGATVQAQLAPTGNGIQLVDLAGGVGTLTVSPVEGSQAAYYLGFVADGEEQTVSTEVDGSGNQVLTSEDRHTLEVDSVFNTLLRLRTALEDADVEEIGRCVDTLATDMERVLQARAEIGSRLQSLEVVKTQLEDENVELQESLSADLDVDLIEAISNLTARQYALQASLQTTASILKYSLLDYI